MFFKDETGKYQYNRIFWTLIIIVIVICISFPFFMTNVLSFCNWGDRGNFGSMFGSISALFSGLAFIGLIITIMMQGDNIKDQSKQFKEHLTRLDNQLEQLKTQNNAIQKANFEDSFFQLINYFNDSVSLIHGKGMSREQYFNGLFKDKIYDKQNAQAIQNYKNIYKDGTVTRKLPLYFRNIEILVNHIHKAKNVIDTNHYIKIFKVQLSESEPKLLSIHFQSEKGKDMRNLAEKYNLIEKESN